jgi:hypothetical protein
MGDVPARQCGSCYFGRQMAGTLCCVRNPPTPDPATAQARWPIIEPTDRCGAYCHNAPNPQSEITPAAPAASALNQKSQIINHKSLALPLHTDAFGDYCKIPLTQGRFAKVDPEDYVWLSQFRWCCKHNIDNSYAVRHVQIRGKTKRIYMHRLIMNIPDHLVCDHANHNGFDNRKRNLRNCTYAQNNANRRKTPGATSQYLGVSYDKRRNKWVAHIKDHGRDRYLGSFDIEEDAARAYDHAAAAVHGPFANLNFPNEVENTSPQRHGEHRD